MLDGVWVTGVFDRVVVARDAGGRALSAEVFDFKTDRVAGEMGLAELVARYSAQLELYRQAAAVLTGLEVNAVQCTLVSTRAGRLVRVGSRAK